MTVEQLWNLISKEGVVKNFDKIYKYFTKKIPYELIEDPGDILTEIVGHLEDQKEFGKLLLFIKLLQDKQPELYINNFEFIDDVLVNYHSFQRNEELLKESFENFIKYPTHGFEYFIRCYKHILYYDHPNILRRVVREDIESIAEHYDEVPDEVWYLVESKIMLALADYLDKKMPDKNELAECENSNDVQIKEHVIEIIEKVNNNQYPTKEIFFKELRKDTREGLEMIGLYWLIYMHNKGLKVYIGRRIWSLYQHIWPENFNRFKHRDRFFRITEKSFEERLHEIERFSLFDNTTEVAAALWGGVYVYDFLKETGIIDDKTYESFSNTVRKLKCKFIGERTDYLWMYDFVHTWPKPDSISEKEYETEHSIFKKSFTLKSIDIADFIPDIKDELQELGELGEWIVEFGKEYMEKLKSGISGLGKILSDKVEFDEDDDFFDDNDESFLTVPTVLSKKRKIGRNEKCPCGSGKKYKKCCGK